LQHPLAFALVAGPWPVAGLGQLAAGGTGPALVLGAGLGVR
jgi:hypothetical protein